MKPAEVALKMLLSALRLKLASGSCDVDVVEVEARVELEDETTVGSGGADDVVPEITLDEDVPEDATVAGSGSKDETVVAVEAVDVRVDTGGNMNGGYLTSNWKATSLKIR